MTRILFKIAGWLAVAAVPFVIGWNFGGSAGVGHGEQQQYNRVVSCLPADSQAALDACLRGQ